MSTSFEWEFLQERIPPDSISAGKRPAGPRRGLSRRAVLLAAILVVLGLGVRAAVVARLKTVEKAEGALRETAELELNCITVGDLGLYRALQDPDDGDWEGHQVGRFLSGRADTFTPAPGLTPSDRPWQIKRVQVLGQTGRVDLVRWLVADNDRSWASLPFRVVWFYRQLEGGSWVHTAPPDDYLGVPYSWHGSRLSVRATEAEAELLDQLAPPLVSAMARACRLLNCPEDFHATLSFEDTLAPEDREGIWVVPALYLAGLPDDENAYACWLNAARTWLVDILFRSDVGRRDLVERVIYSQASPSESPAYWPTGGWRFSTPEAQGTDSVLLADMLELIRKERYKIDSLTVIRNGYVVLDATYHPFPPDTKHQMHAGTHGIISALVGIAIDKGYIQSVGQSLLDFFPERIVANLTPNKQAITLEHLLTMATGLKCRDSDLYDNPGPYEMRASDDWVQFVLDMPMAGAPGQRFELCHGAAHLLSAIIQETTGLSALEFAQEHLFSPLGISDVTWPSNARGNTVGYGELRMRPQDAAKIGYLYLKEGLWDGEQLLPSAWVEASTREQVSAGTVDHGYGYGCWTDDSGFYLAHSANGPFVFVMPEQEMVVVITSHLNDADCSVPQILLNDYIIPAAISPTTLPPCAAGVARLEALIEQAAGTPEVTPQPVPAPPAIAEQVLGETYRMNRNPLGWGSISLVKQDRDEAVLRITWDETVVQTEAEYRLGLDGVQRLAEGNFGLPAAGTGGWEEENLFIAQVHDIGEGVSWRLSLRFVDDIVIATLHVNFRPTVIRGKRVADSVQDALAVFSQLRP